LFEPAHRTVTLTCTEVALPDTERTAITIRTRGKAFMLEQRALAGVEIITIGCNITTNAAFMI
jgi:hypothetical protein